MSYYLSIFYLKKTSFLGPLLTDYNIRNQRCLNRPISCFLIPDPMNEIDPERGQEARVLSDLPLRRRRQGGDQMRAY